MKNQLLDRLGIDSVKTAYKIAKENLSKRYSALGIVAGATHFNDLWIRDCCFAGLGSLKMGDFKPVKTSLKTMMNYIKDDGQIPLRVGQKHFLLKYLKVEKLLGKKVSARFLDDKTNSLPMDSNSLFIILFEAYVKTAKDQDFLKKHFKTLKLAMDWNINKANKECLLYEHNYASWADSLKKTGFVLYTNVLHCEAIRAFVVCAKSVGEVPVMKAYEQFYNQVKANINLRFWTGEFYADRIHKKRDVTFATDGNALAILFGVASKERASKISSYVSRVFDEDFCIGLHYPHFKKEMVYTPFKWIDLGDYHNGLRWLWVGCIEAVSKIKAGLQQEGKEALERMANKIVQYNGVYEVYEPKGTPVKRLFYSSEKTFAWSSGLFVWACHEAGLV